MLTCDWFDGELYMMESLAKFRYVLKPSNKTYNVFMKDSTIFVPSSACKLANPVLNSEVAKKDLSFRDYMLFYKQRVFSTHPECCITFSWIELQKSLRGCLIHISIIILKHFLHLLYLCPCLDPGPFFLVPRFMFYICDMSFIFLYSLSLRLIL